MIIQQRIANFYRHRYFRMAIHTSVHSPVSQFLFLFIVSSIFFHFFSFSINPFCFTFSFIPLCYAFHPLLPSKSCFSGGVYFPRLSCVCEKVGDESMKVVREHTVCVDAGKVRGGTGLWQHGPLSRHSWKQSCHRRASLTSLWHTRQLRRQKWHPPVWQSFVAYGLLPVNQERQVPAWHSLWHTCLFSASDGVSGTFLLHIPTFMAQSENLSIAHRLETSGPYRPA